MSEARRARDGRGRGGRGAGGRLRRRRHRRVHRRADRRRRPALLLHGDEHAAAGRASGDRGDHRARPGRVAAARRRRRAAAAAAGTSCRSAATRSRRASAPRTRRPTSCRRPARSTCTARGRRTSSFAHAATARDRAGARRHRRARGRRDHAVLRLDDRQADRLGRATARRRWRGSMRRWRDDAHRRRRTPTSRSCAASSPAPSFAERRPRHRADRARARAAVRRSRRCRSRSPPPASSRTRWPPSSRSRTPTRGRAATAGACTARALRRFDLEAARHAPRRSRWNARAAATMRWCRTAERWAFGATRARRRPRTTSLLDAQRLALTVYATGETLQRLRAPTASAAVDEIDPIAHAGEGARRGRPPDRADAGQGHRVPGASRRQAVKAGQPLAVMEAMKMEHTISRAARRHRRRTAVRGRRPGRRGRRIAAPGAEPEPARSLHRRPARSAARRTPAVSSHHRRCIECFRPTSPWSKSARATACRTKGSRSRPRTRSSWCSGCRPPACARSRSPASSARSGCRRWPTTPQVMAGIARRPGVRYSVLTPNLKGFEAALASAARRDRRLRRRQRGLQPEEHQLLDRREHRALPPGRRRRARRTASRCARAISCALGCPYQGEVSADEVERVVAADERASASTTAASPTPSASARRGTCRRRWSARCEHFPLAEVSGALPRHLRPGAGQHLRLPARSASTPSTPASPASAAARTRRARPATSRTEDVRLHAATAWASTPASTSTQLVDAGAFISGVLGRAPVSRAGSALLAKRAAAAARSAEAVAQ